MDTRNQRSMPGFTLLELLVVIGIIGVLVAIIAPALRGTRSAALQTVALANVRSVGQVMQLYSGEHDRNPFRGLGEYPGEMTQIFPDFEPEPYAASYFWYPRGVLIATTGHFEQAWLWPSIVVPLSEWPEHWETWVSPRKDRPLPTADDFDLSGDNPIQDQISIRYSNAFVARPEFFSERRGATEAEWRRLLRATRPSEVRYPSSKVMLWDDDLAYRTDRSIERVDGLLDADTPMCFADGHAAARNPTGALEASDNPLSEDGARKLADTKEGILGRDYP
jgi:prepilin-type N-terminal cleavage/methylation domain-containing protein